MTLVKADGTQITKTAGDALVEAVPEEVPMVEVTIAVYEVSIPSGTKYPPVGKQLKFHAGQIIPRKTWDEAFPAATITSVTPATGPAAGGTTITIRGSGFTPGSTAAVGGAAATAVNVIDDGQMTAVTPARTAGAHAVAVTTDSGTASKAAAFTAV